jgi:hypothetical protein
LALKVRKEVRLRQISVDVVCTLFEEAFEKVTCPLNCVLDLFFAKNKKNRLEKSGLYRVAEHKSRLVGKVLQSADWNGFFWRIT